MCLLLRYECLGLRGRSEGVVGCCCWWLKRRTDRRRVGPVEGEERFGGEIGSIVVVAFLERMSVEGND